MDLQEGKHFLYMLGSEQYVDKYHLPNNETETLLFDGREIRPGMVIVSGEEGLRESLDMSKVHRLDFDHVQRRVESNNRWFYVLRAEITEDGVFLLTLHQDGSITKKRSTISESWLVKNESLCNCAACKPVDYRDGLVCDIDAPSLLCTSTAGDSLDGGTTHRCKLPVGDHTWHVAPSGRRWRAMLVNDGMVTD